MAPPVAPTGQPLAEFLDRFLAYVIDALILGVVSIVVFVPLFVVMFATFASNIDPETGEVTSAVAPLTFFGMWLLGFVLLVAANYIYQVEMMYRRGQTIGKRAMKIQIIPVRPGEQLTRGMAAKRWLASFVAGAIIPFWNWIDGLWQLWDKPYRQCLHDKFAETVVIKLST